MRAATVSATLSMLQQALQNGNVSLVAADGFTSVAERAGSYWSGRALGLQNTAQYVAAAAVAPVAGLAISQWGYAATFAISAMCPVLAAAVVPVHDETSPE